MRSTTHSGLERLGFALPLISGLGEFTVIIGVLYLYLLITDKYAAHSTSNSRGTLTETDGSPCERAVNWIETVVPAAASGGMVTETEICWVSACCSGPIWVDESVISHEAELVAERSKTSGASPWFVMVRLNC